MESPTGIPMGSQQAGCSFSREALSPKALAKLSPKALAEGSCRRLVFSLSRFQAFDLLLKPQ
jgi:hypothetical protein